jgi:hypothetical protein
MRPMVPDAGAESRTRLVTPGAPLLRFLQGWDSTNSSRGLFSDLLGPSWATRRLLSQRVIPSEVEGPHDKAATQLWHSQPSSLG